MSNSIPSSLGKSTIDNQKPNELPSAPIMPNPMLGDAFRVYKELSDGNRLWFGTHRNDNMDFEKNIFGGWKPNAYLLSKEVASKICKEYDAKMESAFQSIA